jgi:hypothetical protein
MKNLLLLWLLIYAITGNVAFAEKAMSPVLLTPTNFAKNISKDSIKFTWQNAQNEVNAKVNVYRIIISENSQFNGYTTNTGRCNITCVTSVINSTTFTTGLRSSNKAYYWRVQGISPTENGEWSRTGTFKTDSGAPTITNASATPSSTSLGNAINFSATLSSALPNNYNVKLSYGTSTVNMVGKVTSYSVSQIPTQLGQQLFTVGIYDGSNELKGTLFKGNFEIIKSNSAPTLSLVDAATTATVGTSYSVQLQASDVDNNLQSIIVVWGDGVNDTQTATNGTPITYTHAYATANTYNWSATALDSGNASSIAIAKSVIISAAVVTPPVSASGYTKISNSGGALPDSAKLGSGLNDWACTKDNKTGLIWEVKTDDGGLRDKDWYYSWYKPSGDNGGFAGYTDIDVVYGAPNCLTQNHCNTDAFTNAVNTKGLCGKNDWRMPTKDELMRLIYCSDGKYATDGSCTNYTSVTQPTINSTYFPNTKSSLHWSSSPYPNYSSGAWYVYFKDGGSYSANKNYNFFVRLVR